MWLFCLLALFAPDRAALIEMGRRPLPPPMPHRQIAKPTTAPAGKQLDLVDGDCKVTLFLPAAFILTGDGHVDLTVHFHGGVWFPIDEHLRRGLKSPLLVCDFGQGSSAYAKPFAADPARFERLLALVEHEIGHRATRPARVTQIDLTSFSAGYGAVRELLKQDRVFDRVRRIILCDSLYASWDPATTQPGATSRPSEANMQPFAKFVEAAARGEKTFVLAHSHVPTSYANTVATAAWIIDRARLVKAEAGDTDAARDARYPLLYRADLGHCHVWGYAGEDAQAHLTSVRHLAELWLALDACGDR